MYERVFGPFLGRMFRNKYLKIPLNLCLYQFKSLQNDQLNHPALRQHQQRREHPIQQDSKEFRRGPQLERELGGLCGHFKWLLWLWFCVFLMFCVFCCFLLFACLLVCFCLFFVGVVLFVFFLCLVVFVFCCLVVLCVCACLCGPFTDKMV